MSNHYRQAAVAPAPPSRQRRRDSQNHSPDGRDRPGQEHPAPEDSTKAERAPKTRQVYSSSQTTSLFNSFTSLSDTGKQFFINSPAFSTPPADTAANVPILEEGDHLLEHLVPEAGSGNLADSSITKDCSLVAVGCNVNQHGITQCCLLHPQLPEFLQGGLQRIALAFS